MIKHILLIGSLTLIVNLFSTSCFIFNNYQTAHLLTKNAFAVTPSISLTNYEKAEQDYTQIINNGVRASYGVTDYINLSLEYAHLYFPEYKTGYNYTSFNPTFGIIRDKLAVAISGGGFFGQNTNIKNSANIRTSILLTLPVSRTLSFTISPGYLLMLPTQKKNYSLFPISVNSKYSLKSLPISIIPEFGCTLMKNEHLPFIFGGIGIEWSVFHPQGIASDIK